MHIDVLIMILTLFILVMTYGLVAWIVRKLSSVLQVGVNKKGLKGGSVLYTELGVTGLTSVVIGLVVYVVVSQLVDNIVDGTSVDLVSKGDIGGEEKEQGVGNARV